MLHYVLLKNEEQSFEKLFTKMRQLQKRIKIAMINELQVTKEVE